MEKKKIETIPTSDGIFALIDNPSVVSKNDLSETPLKLEGVHKHNTARVTAIILGVFAGIGGATHGPGEILQGNIAPSGILIESWPTLTALIGEPAMTIVPNFLLTGILTLIFGFLVTLWSIRYIRWTHGGLGLILLSIAMLLVGGGLIPPIIGILAGLLGMRVNYDLTSKKRFILNMLTIAAVPVGLLLVNLFG